MIPFMLIHVRIVDSSFSCRDEARGKRTLASAAAVYKKINKRRYGYDRIRIVAFREEWRHKDFACCVVM